MAKVLVIEDDKDLREGVARFLERSGHEVLQAEDGRRALKLSEAERPDLVITDLNMPEMDGIEVCSRS